MSEEMRRLGLCFLLSVVGVKAFCPAEPTDFVVEINKAREAMLDEPAKSYYQGPFNKAFYERYSGWLNHCTQQTGQQLADLDLVVTLDAQGKVSDLLSRPESVLTDCFAGQVKKEQFPAPPSAGLRVPVSVRITKP